LASRKKGRHQGGHRRHPGGTQEARDFLETECVFSYAPAHKSDAGNHLRVDGSDMTLTVYRACAQEFANVGTKIAAYTIPNTEDTPPEPLQQRLLGEHPIYKTFPWWAPTPNYYSRYKIDMAIYLLYLMECFKYA